MDLAVDQPISTTPQPVTGDQPSSTSSALYIATTSVSIPRTAKLIFGVGGDGTGEYIENAPGYGLSFYSANNEQLRITQNSVNIPRTVKLTFGVGGDGTGEYIQNSRYGLSFYANDAEQLRITPGNVAMPTLPVGQGSDLYADVNGNVFRQGSSARYKEDITAFKDDFAKVLELEPVSFRYRDSGHAGVGYLAEDLHDNGLGSLVLYDNEGQPEGINYKMLPVYLLEIVKAHQEMLKQLQARLSELPPA